MLKEPESQLGFIFYGIQKAIRYPHVVLRDVNPRQVIRAELEFRNHRVPIDQFVAYAAESSTNAAQRVLGEIEMPEPLQRYKSRKALYAITRLLRPEFAIETGCGGGYAAAHILTAMSQNQLGHLTSVDDAHYYDAQKFDLPKGTPCGGLVPYELHSRWTLLQCAEQSLRVALERAGPIQMFIHDSLHTRANMLLEFGLAWEHLRPGGVLISHDIWYPWVEFAQQVNRNYRVYQQYGVIVK
jgi:hypothetical protein